VLGLVSGRAPAGRPIPIELDRGGVILHLVLRPEPRPHMVSADPSSAASASVRRWRARLLGDPPR
jgi:hypothetical protein